MGRSKRQVGASIPLHVKEAMLEEEFPHVRGSGNDGGGGDHAVDYTDCVPTLSNAETTHLRNAMHNHEKQRLMETMEQFSRQMEAFHEVLEENDALKQEMSRAKRENEEKVSDLEKRFIDTKLALAQCQSREDHTRLKTGRLEKK